MADKRKTRIKRGDKVVVKSGADKSNEPHEVLKVNAEDDTVVVQGVNMRWKHLRRSQANPKGGRVRKEFPIQLSNVQIYSEKAKKGVRVRFEIKDGKKVRVGTCGTVFE